jgi:hypothetical protein
MNSKAVYALLLTLALLIVLPVVGTVDAITAANVGDHSALVADGTPAPPPVPHPWFQSAPELVADGTPAPPPVPNPWLLEPALVADGTPAPPPVPNPWLMPAPELVADGTPAPPPVPNPWLVPQSELIAA